MSQTFRALVVDSHEPSQCKWRIADRSLDEFADAEVLIQVHYSALNYKDALSASGHRGVTRRYPHTPGIDASGLVVRSRSKAWAPGQPVLVTGYDLGSNSSGGLAEYIGVPADWVVRKPDGLSLFETMALGTAGFTAALALHRLTSHGLKPVDAPVLVTGATGGVGSLATALLSALGCQIAALTGKPEMADYLRQLGAAEIIDRTAFCTQPDKPLLTSRFTAVVDNVGGPVLATALKTVAANGAVASCGLAGSAQLHTTVYPFILRNVSLLGVDSAHCPMQRRQWLWQQLAGPWRIKAIDTIARQIDLDQVEPAIEAILAGTHHGRTVVRVRAGVAR